MGGEGGEADAGFSTGTPWLPIPDAHRAQNVAAQNADGNSVLAHARRFLQWRRTQPALRTGSITFLDAPEPVLAFVREQDAARVLVVFNLSAAPVEWRTTQAAHPLDGHGLPMGELRDGSLHLPAHGLYVAALGAAG